MSIPVANFAIATDVPQSDITIPTENPNSGEVIATASPSSNITIATPNPDFHYVPGEKVDMTKQLPFIPNYGVFNPNTYLQGMSDYEIMAKVVQFYNESVQAYNQVYAYQGAITTSLETTENYFNEWGSNFNNDQKAAFSALQDYFNNWGTLFNNDQKSAFNHLQIYFNHWGTELSNDSKTAFNQLQAFVNEFFQNLDITAEIEAIIERLYNAGRFDDVILSGAKQATSNWLASHLVPGALTIDATLDIPAAAADAAVVGDALRPLYDELPFAGVNSTGEYGTITSRVYQLENKVDVGVPLTTLYIGALVKVGDAVKPGDSVHMEFACTPFYASTLNETTYGKVEYTGARIVVLSAPVEITGKTNLSPTTMSFAPGNYSIQYDESLDSQLDSINASGSAAERHRIYTADFIANSFITDHNALFILLQLRAPTTYPDGQTIGSTYHYRYPSLTVCNELFNGTVVLSDELYAIVGSSVGLPPLTDPDRISFNAKIFNTNPDNVPYVPVSSITVRRSGVLKKAITPVPVYKLVNERIYNGNIDITDTFIETVISRNSDGLEPPKLNYTTTNSLGYNIVYQYNLLTTQVLPMFDTTILYTCSDNSVDYYVRINRSNMPPPPGSVNHTTVTSYSVQNAKYGEVVKRHILEYDPDTSTLKEGEVTYSYELLKSLLLDQQTFVIALINGRVYYPESISDTEIVLSATYANNTSRGYVTSYVAKLNTNSLAITLVEYESEKEANKNDVLTLASLKRGDLYPSMKAIGSALAAFAYTFEKSGSSITGIGPAGSTLEGADCLDWIVTRSMFVSRLLSPPLIRDAVTGKIYRCCKSLNNEAFFEHLEFIANGASIQQVRREVIKITPTAMTEYTEHLP